jgi:uroporphyrin-3 C-methyltransferase/uroporphyrinogen III methyltransferase/synthase
MLTESERRLVRQQLELEIQLARTAVLERRQAAFRASLVAADAILNRDFETSAQSIVESRSLLGEMTRVELSPPLPDIGDSLTLFRSATGAR